MKILHVTQNYHPSVGGTQYLIKKISEYFYAVHHDDVTVLTSNSMYGPNRQRFEEIKIKEEVINGVKIKRYPFLRFHIPLIKIIAKTLKRTLNKPLPNYLYTMLHGPVSSVMRKELNTMHADVIGASSIDYLFAGYAINRTKKQNAKPFVLHGALHLHTQNVPEIYKKRIKAADYYIANTEYEKKIVESWGINSEMIKVIGVGTDIHTKADFSVTDEKLRLKYNIPGDAVVITYIGRQETLKSINILLNAFRMLYSSNTNTKLLICGATGSYSAQLRKAAADYNEILLFSNITDLQKTEVLRLTDILVLPSKEESFGIVFLEAWSFSKVVIGANIGAIASVIEDGKDGLLFNAEDAADLCEKLQLLVSDKPLRQKMGKAGNKKFKENYSWDIIAEKFRQVYQMAITKFSLQKSAS